MASPHSGRVHSRSMTNEPKLLSAVSYPSTSSAPPPRLHRLALLGAALLLAATASLAADATMLFEPIGVFDLELDGKVISSARIFHSSEAGAVLAMAPELPFPIAVVPRNKTVQRLDAADLRDQPLGSIVWTAEGRKDAVATFEMVDAKPVFELEGKKVRFIDRAPLLGSKTIEEIVAYDRAYAYQAAKVELSNVYLDVLQAWPDEVVVKVFFSTQCQVCRELMPNILKLEETLQNPKFRFEFHGMPLPATSDPLAAELQITTFPTAILYQEGKEVGRAIGHSWRIPTMALHNALRGIKVDTDKLIQRQ